MSRLSDVTTPILNFPAANNAAIARMVQYGGTTVDGVASALSPLLTVSQTRY